MDLNKMASQLKMQNLYFSECSIKRALNITDNKLSMSLKQQPQKTGEHSYSIAFILTVQNSDHTLDINVCANADFELEAEDYSVEEELIKKNTVAIVFPFIRSQVTLLTSQPNMQPIIIPPINFTTIQE